MFLEVLKGVIRGNQERDFTGLRPREVSLPTDTEKVISVIGSRRAGKTHLLYLTIKSLLDRGVARQQIVFVNFEDERLASDQFQFDMILEAYRSLYPDQVLADCYFFFDEIQNLPNWEKSVRRVYDDVCRRIFLTGSNAHLLSREIATELRGRSIAVEVFPLNFSEYLNFQGIEADQYVPSSRAKIGNAFDEYLRKGGFPEVCGMKEPWAGKTLQEYFNVMIYRDLVERYAVSQPLLLKYFVKKVFAGVGKPLSINKIYNEFRSAKYAVGKSTLYDFQEMLQAAFVGFQVEKFDYSEMRRANLEKKIYAVDSGLLSAVEISATENWGKLLENAVIIEWIKRGYVPFFYKQGKECDLVWMKGQKYQAAQISFSVLDERTLERELEGLEEACRFLGISEGWIFTAHEERELTYRSVRVRVMPAWKYFLREHI